MLKEFFDGFRISVTPIASAPWLVRTIWALVDLAFCWGTLWAVFYVAAWGWSAGIR